MNFMDYDYSGMDYDYSESIKSLHVYHDIYFVKKVMLNLLKCTPIEEIFVIRGINFSLRTIT